MMVEAYASNSSGKIFFRRLAWILVATVTFVSCNAQACPDISLSGTSLAYSSDELYTAKTHKVVAGGGIDLANCTHLPGLGFVATAPDFVLTFSGNTSGRALEIRTNSDCDSILLVNDANGVWHYDDDLNGNLDAKIRLAKSPTGVCDIWVGTRYSDGCSATITIETF